MSDEEHGDLEYGFWEEDFGLDVDNYNIWTCVKCDKEFVDPEDFPDVKIADDLTFERRLYWLNVNEPICSSCAIAAGIPPIDEG